MNKPSWHLLAILIATLCLPGCRIHSIDAGITSGVSLELAKYRAGSIENLTYDFDLTIPASMDELVQGKVEIRFELLDDSRPVVIDFNVPPESHLLSVNANGEIMPLIWQQGHIVINDLEAGPQHIVITFNAGDSSLNRNPDFLYTLFVPDRASFALPLFDQPDLKGRFSLTLRTPIDWEAIGNGPLVNKEITDDQAIFVFGETRPISTYLFSFAAGQFQVEEAERGGRTMRMLHRETDTEKVERNRGAIFDLHHTALTWLEDYTGIPYPFQKFDFALIPPFQYGGMEHPGAIQYRASSLMLEASATKNQYLGRASLIAHETAHMWFGDLVTMQWFDDVWMKEVFANFMAAKIVHPSFPEVNHDLRFLLAHFPSAYSVDRTAGANPIRQPLENLQMAGTLYGAIIYQKAPIVMKHLERVVGEETFQSGLQQYLSEYAYRNATWHDLIAILDDLTDEDLRSWSQVWVSEPGRPQIESEMTFDDAGRLAGVTLRQSDPAELGRQWAQRLDVVLGYEDRLEVRPVYMNDDEVNVPDVAGLEKPQFLLPNGDGLGYGLFIADESTYAHLLQHVDQLDNPVMRGAAWITLWEGLLEGLVAPDAFIDASMQQLAKEEDELNVQRILGYLTDAYWRFQAPEVRNETAPALEHLFLSEMNTAASASMKASYFNAFRGVVTSDAGIAYLQQVWEKKATIEGLPFSIRDYSRMAQALAVRDVPNAEDILDTQEERITNPDQRARFVFVRQALSQSAEERDTFFETLAHEENRRQEPWVLDAISMLHHPLRAASSETHIAPSLELLEEIQRTGDIFFPKRWLDATLSGYQSASAAQTVRQFLDDNPDLSPRLRAKVLQSADMLFRAARITG